MSTLTLPRRKTLVSNYVEENNEKRAALKKTLGLSKVIEGCLNEEEAYSKFLLIGFDDIEIKMFLTRQPAVYTKVIRAVETAQTVKDLPKVLHSLPSAKGYRLKRLEKYLEPIGPFALEFFKDTLRFTESKSFHRTTQTD